MLCYHVFDLAFQGLELVCSNGPRARLVRYMLQGGKAQDLEGGNGQGQCQGAKPLEALGTTERSRLVI